MSNDSLNLEINYLDNTKMLVKFDLSCWKLDKLRFNQNVVVNIVCLGLLSWIQIGFGKNIIVLRLIWVHLYMLIMRKKISWFALKVQARVRQYYDDCRESICYKS